MIDTAREAVAANDRVSRRLVWAGAALFVCLAAAAVGWSWLLQHGIRSRLAEIRARGEPLTYAELDASYPHPPAGQDTTDLLMQAGESLARNSTGAQWRALPFISEGREPPPPGQPWTELDLAQNFLDDNAPYVRQLHEAAALGCQARVSGVTTPNAIGAVMNYAGPLRSAARVLRLEANVHMHSGDAQAAAEAIFAGLTLQRALKNEPVLVSQLVRLAIFGAAADELKAALASVSFSSEDLVRMQESLARIELKKSLFAAFVGARVFEWEMIDAQSREHPTLSAALQNIVGSPEKTRFLDLVTDFIEIGQKPWPEMLELEGAIATKYQARSSRGGFPFDLLSASFATTVNGVVRAELTRRLALVAVAVEHCRQQHGAPPTDLVALVPAFLSEVPDDPTSGKPFSYLARDGGYVLFSATGAFPLPSGESPDAETGANPSFVFRRPAVAEAETRQSP